MIPKIIHKVWLDFGNGKNPSEEYLENESICKQLNKGWKVMQWNEKKSINLIRDKYPFFYDYFINYEYTVQKVDAIRYFILYEYGGVYMDMDIECKKPFNVFTDNKVYLVEDVNGVCKFNNFLIASPPKHKFWLHIFKLLIKNYKKQWYDMRGLYILNSTGPGLLTQAYDSYDKKEDIDMLSKELFNPCDACGNCLNSNSYIVHNGHATWTKFHEKYYMKIYCNRYYFIIVALVMILAIIGVILYHFRKSISKMLS